MIKWELIIPIVIAIIAAVPGILAIRGQRRRDAAQAADAITEAALGLIEPYKRRVAELETEVGKLKARLCELELEQKEQHVMLNEVIEGAHQLAHQLQSMKQTPVYEPPRTPRKKGAVK